MSDPTAASAFAAAHDELQVAGPAPAVDAAPVGARPEAPASRAAGVITDILAGLYQAQPAIFAATRASPRAQAQVSLGLGLAGIIASAVAGRRR